MNLELGHNTRDGFCFLGGLGFGDPNLGLADPKLGLSWTLSDPSLESLTLSDPA